VGWGSALNRFVAPEWQNGTKTGAPNRPLCPRKRTHLKPPKPFPGKACSQANPRRRKSYLFEHAGVDPSQEPPPATLARSARRLRSLIAQWWDQLEPEDTLGAPAALVEETLVTVARTASKLHPPVVKRTWIQGKHFSKSRVPPSDRFVAALERLGVLAPRAGGGSATQFAANWWHLFPRAGEGGESALSRLLFVEEGGTCFWQRSIGRSGR
jgi:hypothetical protein